MNTSREQRAEQIFYAALDRQGDSERNAYLDGACGSDCELRARADALLKAHAQAGAFMSSPLLDADSTRASKPADQTGTIIGPYKILQLIGEGGFGAVYMAEQERPVRRKVALKIIKLGMDTKQIIARFEAERQALAMMDHPNIAKVLDAGATENGRPYFVMELVRGIPITEYCDRQKLSTRERLGLFMAVCGAVQHAHQKGIIHRDIKPSNVLVTLYDSNPVPKVIDFGIAKATSHRLTDKTLFTEFRQFIGTPEYMSPDQAELSGLDVDTRTDIYSLGVLLYVLLTGTTPLDPKTLRRAGYGEIQRIIRDQEPPSPSARVHTLASSSARALTTVEGESSTTADAIARQRQTDPAGLSRLLRGELDWIVMRAMEKDRTRRYQTANELAADVRRFLHNEPIVAGPPSALYRFRKFVRRHRVVVTASAVVVAALVIDGSVATVGFLRARREAEHSRQVSAFLQDLTMRMEAGQEESTELSVNQVIERAGKLLGEDHGLIGTLLLTRASSLMSASRLDEALSAAGAALKMQRDAHPGDHPAVAGALTTLGRILEERGESGEAERVYREAVGMKKRVYGTLSKSTADTTKRLVTVLCERFSLQDHAEIKQLWSDTVAAYEKSLGEKHPTTVGELCVYATWLANQSEHQEAAPLLRIAVERAREALPDHNVGRFLAVNALAQQYLLYEGDLAKAMPLMEELAQLARRTWGENSLVTASVVAQLAQFFARSGDMERAGANLELYLAIRRAGRVTPILQILGLERQAQFVLNDWLVQHPKIGKELMDLMVEDVRQTMGPNSTEGRALLDDAAEWLSDNGFPDEADARFAELLELQRQSPVAPNKNVANTLMQLGLLRMKLGKPADAEAFFRDCLQLRREAFPAGHWLIGATISALGQSLADGGRAAEAEPLLVEGNAILENHPDTPPNIRRQSIERLIGLYEGSGRADQADSCRARLGAGDQKPEVGGGS